jgi:hypothetical protein
VSLLNHLVTAGDIPVDDLHVKLMVQGRSGSGKSTLGAKMPKPLILLTEANGLPSIRAANPAAIVIRIYDPQAYGKTTQFEVLEEAMKLALAGSFDAAGVESVVADSATEIQRIIKEQILREKGVLRDPNYLFTQQDWGLLTERTRRWARVFRDLPYHTLLITLSAEEKDEESGRVTNISPSFEGRKLSQEILQFCSAGGFAFKRPIKVEGKETGDVEFRVLFQGPQMYVVKPVAPLRNVESDNPSEWIARIIAHKPGDAKLPPLDAPPAPKVEATPPADGKSEGTPAADGKPAGEGATTTSSTTTTPAANAGPTKRSAPKKANVEADPTA